VSVASRNRRRPTAGSDPAPRPSPAPGRALRVRSPDPRRERRPIERHPPVRRRLGREELVSLRHNAGSEQPRPKLGDVWGPRAHASSDELRMVLRPRGGQVLHRYRRRDTAGRMTRRSAAVSPCEGHEQEPVRFQPRRGGAWKTVSMVPLRPGLRRPPGQEGEAPDLLPRGRPADEDHAPGTSKVVKVRVRSHRRSSSPNRASIGRT
jgi:hypothetical protein